MAGFREWGKQQAKQGAGALHRLVKRVPGAVAAVRRTTCNAADIIGQKRTEWAQRWQEDQRDHTNLKQKLRKALEEDGPEGDLPPIQGEELRRAYGSSPTKTGR